MRIREEGLSLLDAWNDTAHPFASEVCLHHLFEEQVGRTPDAVALIHADEAITYAELNRRANRVAHYLRKLGVQTRTPVAICLHRSMEMVVGLLGILKAGCPYVPIDPEYPTERIAHMVRDCGPAVIITEEALRTALSPIEPAKLALDSEGKSINEEPDTNPNVVVESGDLVYVIYTSGSTGQPKGAMNTHRGVVNRLLWMQATFGLTADDRVLQKTPHSFDVSAWEFFWPLITGAGLVMARPGGHRDPEYLVQCIERHRITTIHFVPSMLYAFLDAPGLDRCKCLKRVICSGEAMGVDLQDRFFARMDAELHNLYGPTEAAIDVTHWVCRRDHSLGFVPIGRPIWNTQIHILDEAMQPVPPGEMGEIHIGGVGVARGYLNRPELTAERFIADPWERDAEALLYKTGDLGRFLPDGNIQYLGRIDHQVKLRGQRIELGEIETVLGKHPLVHQAVVTAREDRPGDQRLVAYLVLRPDADPANAVAVIRGSIREWLPDYMVPSAWQLLKTMPLTSSGKVDRKALPAPLNGRAIVENGELPSTDLQRKLAKIWCSVLGLTKVGIRENFFELGGHSLLAMRVVAEIRRQLGVELPIRAIFASPTIVQLAGILDAAGPQTPMPELKPGPLDQPLPLSFAQQRLWFLGEYECRQPVYNLAFRINLAGRLNQDYLREALQRLVDRHASLRTNFRLIENQPAQLIAARRTMELPVSDLSAILEGDRNAQLDRFIGGEARRAFDLRTDPLFRAHLLKLSDQQHVLLLNMHHIVSDGWSMGVLFDSISVVYRALCNQATAELPPLPIQYPDYARWQREWLSGEVLAKLVDYWKHQLDGAPPMLALPADRPRPSEQSFRGDCIPVHFPEELCRGLHTLSRRQGATLYMSLLAGYALLLHRHSGQSDIVIGSPISGRTRAELEQLVGFLVNMLALRIDVDPARTVNQFLARVREIALDAYAHQDLPFEKLVEELKPVRNPSHAPIFQTALVFLNTPDAPVSMPELNVACDDVHTGTAKFDLTLSLRETDTGINGTLEFNTDIFDVQTAQRMIEHYRLLLDAMAASPEMPVGQLSMLSTAEREQLLHGWNQTDRQYPSNRCVHELFAEQAARAPDAVALVCADAELTYGQLNERAEQLARYLLGLGAGPGALIAMCTERSAEMVIAMLGIWKTGAAYVAIDHDDPAERLAFILADANAAVLLTQEKLLPRLAVHQGRTVCLDRDWEAIASATGTQPVAGITPDAVAHVIYTSGSTGQPKGVEVRHRGIVRLVCGQDYVKFGPDRVVLQLSSICFDASTFELWAPLLHGGRCVLCNTRLPNPAELQTMLRQHRVTTLWLTSSFFNALMDVAPDALADVEELMIGGEALSVPHVQSALTLLPRTQLINGYGPTENTTFTTCYRIPRSLDVHASVPIGRPIANTRVYILDAQRQPVPRGVVGEIYAGGDGIAAGYRHRPQLTAERFVPDPFSTDAGELLYRTGDLGRYLPDGNIEFLGRIDFQVKIRGYRIEPGEIELVLEQHAAVRQAVVLVEEQAARGRYLTAYLVLHDDAADALTDIKDDLRSKLPEYMVPSEWVVVEQMPLNSSGKLDRQSLPALKALPVSGKTYVPPRTDLEETLERIWRESLHLDRVGIHDNLFDIGGHSLMTVEVSSKIEASLGITVPLITFFRAPTIAQLAEVLNTRQFPRQDDSIILLQSAAGTLPPFFCISGIGGDAAGLRELAQQLGRDRSVYCIQPANIGGDGIARNMESIAALHVDSLRSVQASGPYHLVGFSVGGVIAFEMARQLHAAGETVQMLVLVDSYAPGYPIVSPIPVRIALHLREMVRNPATAVAYVRQKLEARARRAPLHEPVQRGSVESAIESRSLALHRALPAYQPAPYSGSVLVCRATVVIKYLGSHYDDPLLGWGKWLRGEIASQPIPGLHLELVKGPGSIRLAHVVHTFMKFSS